MRLLVFVTVMLLVAIMTVDVEARRQRHISSRRYMELLKIADKLGIKLTPADLRKIWRYGFFEKVLLDASVPEPRFTMSSESDTMSSESDEED